MRVLFPSMLMFALLSSASAGRAGEVNLYTSNTEDAVAAAVDLIREKNPDIKVNVIAGSSGALLRRIDAEKGAPSADIFWSSGFSTLEEFKSLFVKYDSQEVSHVIPSLRATESPWVGTNTHVMVLMINKDVLGRDTPTTWQEVLKPEWKGKVTMADPANSSSAYAQLYGVYSLYGDEGIRELADNVELQGETSGAYKAVAQGEYPIGLTMEYAAQRYVAGGQQNIQVSYPKDGTFLSPEGMALIANGPHPDDAKRVYELFLSQEMQGALVKVTLRRPSRSDVDEALKASGLPTMDKIKIIDVDQHKAGADRGRILDIWTKARG
ncbi:extracellular solute-binding protein [Ensifer sp. ENS04]|uniref:extracellular solute-binding protein n=1 Tax=Ensifer sp. ENS04 TaxID=2769281 RepID=UPI00177ABB68|nr:extracellular solute-binding protein [Ensifer sp. ENS04]MBD9538928.1 extracellular solute-binding protein [Ensifer sp. ENS04]